MQHLAALGGEAVDLLLHRELVVAPVAQLALDQFLAVPSADDRGDPVAEPAGQGFDGSGGVLCAVRDRVRAFDGNGADGARSAVALPVASRRRPAGLFFCRPGQLTGMMAGVDSSYRQRSDQEVERDVIALMAAAFSTEPGQVMPDTGRPPWTDADTFFAFAMLMDMFLEFARAADQAGVSFPDFLQHRGLHAAARDGGEPSRAQGAGPGITFADDDGNIIAWFRITPGGQLDAGGDTAMWTPAARSFIAELRRQAVQS